MINQIGNSASGDIIGTQNIISAPISPMTALIEQYHKELSSDKNLSSFIETLQHYLSNETVSDIRSLEDKLTSSNRQDLVNDAILKKQNATKFILQNQSSKATQTIIAHILAEMAVRFEMAIKPLIQEGKPREYVENEILEKVISPAFKALESNPLGLNLGHIQNFLYFLAGNCHVRWDKC